MPTGEVVRLENWEFQGRTWVGEAVGFTEWLCLEDDPAVLRSLSLDLLSLPEDVGRAMLSRLELPLAQGMTMQELEGLLGRPISSAHFVAARASSRFRTAGSEAFDIDCTVSDEAGLIYVVVTSSPVD